MSVAPTSARRLHERQSRYFFISKISEHADGESPRTRVDGEPPQKNKNKKRRAHRPRIGNNYIGPKLPRHHSRQLFLHIDMCMGPWMDTWMETCMETCMDMCRHMRVKKLKMDVRMNRCMDLCVGTCAHPCTATHALARACAREMAPHNTAFLFRAFLFSNGGRRGRAVDRKAP